MYPILRPSFLQENDKVIIVSPSGSVESRYIDGAMQTLAHWGLRVEVGNHARNQYGRFCGTIEERLNDLQLAMDDPDAKMILCSRGGYGTVHLVQQLNFEGITKHPKWLIGYSDITVLHQSFLQNKIVSLHAPMAKHLYEDAANQSSLYLKDTLFGNLPQYTIQHHNLNREGNAQGTLFGGNLAVLCSLMGSQYAQFPTNGILFIEDISEEPYKIDRMMWTLKIAGVFAKISGIIIGSFADCREDPLMYAPVYESIQRIVFEYNIPVAFGFPVGHANENYPLLHGSCVQLEVNSHETKLSYVNS